MKIVLFRHAKRDHHPSAKGALNARGRAQSQEICELVDDKTLPKPVQLLVSPQRRARQTFEPLSRHLQIELKTVEDLDERKQEETSTKFCQRIQTFLQWAGTQKDTLFLVSHLDWIEEALNFIPCDTDLNDEKYRTWPTAQFMIFEVQDGLWSLIKFGGTSQ